jgi:hypothetical protein
MQQAQWGGDAAERGRGAQRMEAQEQQWSDDAILSAAQQAATNDTTCHYG